MHPSSQARNFVFVVIATLLAVCWGRLQLQAADAPLELFSGRDVKGWRAPVGDWIAAQAVSLSVTNEKKFEIVQGAGVLVNGAKGNTRNILTEIEHGDVEAHVEFTVPKNSNSGIYFMGRYEIQVLDSLGGEVTEVWRLRWHLRELQ